MRYLCFYFQVHQPFRLRTYRFFEIGNDHYYYDDYQNRYLMRRIAQKCYLPANEVLLSLFKEYGCRFKVAFSITGIALEQFELYAPEVLESFQELAKTNCVEFLTETYSHSLSSLKSKDEFIRQTQEHASKIKELFGQEPKVFRNTELIYSDSIGETVLSMGYNTMLTEGAKHVLGWKSPNYLYCNAINPKLKLLLKNYRLSDDIAFRFSLKTWDQWPLTADKWAAWLNALPPNDEVCNIFIDYETFGEHQPAESGIFEFLKALPKIILTKTNFVFATPSEVASILKPVAPLSVPYPISWADEERDLSAWLGNEMQQDAFENLYLLEEKIKLCNDPDILKDWKYLQASDHFYYMCTKWFSDGAVHKYFNPYDSPYTAFINYMNVLSDFSIRVDKCFEKYNKELQTKQQENQDSNSQNIESPVNKETSSLKPSKTTKKTTTKSKTEKNSKTTKETEEEIKDTKSVKIENFESILNISDNEIKKVIKELDHETIAMAIKTASEEIQQKFLNNSSQTTRKKIQETIQNLKKTSTKDVKKCREIILETINKIIS